MKKSWILSLALVAVGCASYNSANLSALSPKGVKSQSDDAWFKVACKAYSVGDCMRYLDRNVIAKGYQPVQIYIKNESKKTYTFSPDQISLPVANSAEVAYKVHTNTAGRVAAYTIGGFVLVGPLLWIPAVVDGIKSRDANIRLDADYKEKVAKKVEILPGESYNSVVFVPKRDYRNEFTVALKEDGTENFEVVTLNAS